MPAYYRYSLNAQLNYNLLVGRGETPKGCECHIKLRSSPVTLRTLREGVPGHSVMDPEAGRDGEKQEVGRPFRKLRPTSRM